MMRRVMLTRGHIGSRKNGVQRALVWNISKLSGRGRRPRLRRGTGRAPGPLSGVLRLLLFLVMLLAPELPERDTGANAPAAQPAFASDSM